ncbi:nicotinate-nucleotide--dimethylbenzimidazole phosphoribosyltransferase [Natranaerofaba carboxydovora]|uniref:nicotinate-nucleotide--dimethylbenzimidazole phosphoribosyltransferase n=1 Tax=Natranaerofaba carboxydovora TaxID=2742683 RepID=UPI001F132662|nr:nicotinate-nucleotide--dimethylbenzimidazole phosphoribosyltransferase [Natranaerofaba carboxydovora]UMZ74634.1 Nicotinate-nucleotide--dimethylbenzimidazole phosphoribosyltransferase [Natranaerofaba carboxydovora]
MSEKLKDVLDDVIEGIEPLDEEAMKKAQERLDDLTKPPGSLGVLEELAKKLAGIYKEPIPSLKKKAGVLMAADHGVVEEKVSAFPKEVTAQMVQNFAGEGAAINVLSNHEGVELTLVDVGVYEDISDIDKVLHRKVAPGTKNMAKEPAMTKDEALKAMQVGFEIAEKFSDDGVGIVSTGEMGIGNTTPSAAIIYLYGDAPIRQVVGRGTGVEDDRLENKIKAIEKAIEVNSPDPDDPLDVLSKIGGLEIAGLCGVFLGCASKRIPVMIDGFISGAAAVMASKFCEGSVNYMIGSHLSKEPGHNVMLSLLGIKPMFSMDMRLGEGTGAVLAMNSVEAAVKIINEMATFSDAGVSKDE